MLRMPAISWQGCNTTCLLMTFFMWYVTWLSWVLIVNRHQWINCGALTFAFRFSPHRMLFLSADLPIYAARIDGIGCKIWWCNTKPIQTMLYLLRKFTGFINYEYNLMAQFVCNPYMLSCASLFVHLSCWFFCVVSYNPFGSAGKEAWRSDIFGLRVCEWMSGR